MLLTERQSWPLCYETNNYSPTLADHFAEPLDFYPELIEQLRAAATSGFAFVGLDLGNIGRFLLSGKTLATLRATMDELGLRCLEVANVTLSDDRDTTLSALQHALEVASAVSARFIQVSVFGSPQHAAVVAKACEEKLADTGIRLALEYLPFSPIDSINAARAFIRAGQLRHTQIVLDNWHFNHGPDRWEDLETLPVDEIAYVQFSDHSSLLHSNDLLFETVNHRRLPGHGHLPLERFCATLQRNGYGGVVSAEVLSDASRQWPPAIFAAAEYQATRVFWP